MGLDLSHGDFYYGYSRFNLWRNDVAELAGYALEEITTRGGFPARVPSVDWDAFDLGNALGEWETTPSDPLLVLLAHSDCDGTIHPAQAAPLADRLEELLSKVPASTGGYNPADRRIDSLRSGLERFIESLRAALAAGEDLEFI